MIDLIAVIPDVPPAVEFGWVGRLFLLVLLVGVPFLATLQPREPIELPPRIALYASTAVVIWVLAGLTGIVLVIEDIGFDAVGLRLPSSGKLAAWTVAATLGALVTSLVITRAASRLGAREAPLVFYLMPETDRERWAFVGLSASAGFCEEFIYHGYTLASLAAWLDSGWLAAIVANLAFGVLHGYQNAVGVVRAGVMGYVLTIPVVVGAGVWPAVLAHFLVNVLLGFGLWKAMVPPDQREAVDAPPIAPS